MEAPEAALSFLGLAARSGAVAWGTDLVREAARRGALRLALLAGDASENSRAKLIPLLEARSIPYRVVADREILGRAVGRPPLAAVGVTDAGMARRLGELLPGSAGQESTS